MCCDISSTNIHNTILAAGFSYLACCMLIYMFFFIFLALKLLMYIDYSVKFGPDKRMAKLRQKTFIFFRIIILLATGYSLCCFSFSIWQAVTSSPNHLGLSYASFVFIFEIPIEVLCMIFITYVTKKVASGDMANTSSTSGQQPNSNEKGAPLSSEEIEVVGSILRSTETSKYIPETQEYQTTPPMTSTSYY